MIKRKYIALSIHTEALHRDEVWRTVNDALQYFFRHQARATWFSINPTFTGYRAMGFDEKKWEERLKIIKNFGHEIQQHTHFYKSKEGVPKGEGYDLSREHIRYRIAEDKKWLEDLGYSIDGFVSGAWKVNDDMFAVLNELGYMYDSSFRSGVLRHIHDIIELPSSGHLRMMLIDFFKLKTQRFLLDYKNMKFQVFSFHDYDLSSAKFRYAVKLFIFLYSLLGYQFVSLGDIYSKIKE